MSRLRTLRVSGRPYDRGYAHGTAFAADIAALTEERLRLATDPFWTDGRAASLDEVLALGQACLRAHEAYAPALVAEMRGMADATGLGLNELVIMNGFTDFVDVVANAVNAVNSANAANSANTLPRAASPEPVQGDAGGCTAFVVDPAATADGAGYVGQTWDMHSSATPYVLLLELHPDEGPALLAFTLTGCVGMIGMNEAGVAVGINNLQGADGRAGVHWPFAVRQMLAQRDVEAALDALRAAPLSGAHNYLLLGPDADGALRGYNVEATATRLQATPVANGAGFLAHTNHCLAPDLQQVERPRSALSLESSCARLDQAERLLAAQAGSITVDSLMEMTRHHDEGGFSVCAHARPGYDIESSGACIMAPRTRELWALWGNPCRNAYERFVVDW